MHPKQKWANNCNWGNGGITIGDSGDLIKFGDSVLIPAHSVRSISNINNKPLHVISIKYTTD